jgi:F0F1-type ATP synthase assembly protein I
LRTFAPKTKNFRWGERKTPKTKKEKKKKRKKEKKEKKRKKEKKKKRKKEEKMNIKLKRAQLFGILLIISVLANVFLGILYMTKQNPSLGDSPLGLSALGLGGGVTRRSKQIEGAAGDEEETLEYDYEDQSAQALAEMRAQPQAQMGGRARLGAVTQRGGRIRNA